MQRDMNLIRRLLLSIEAEASTIYRFDMDGVDDVEKWYHVSLLTEAGFIKGVTVRWAADGTGPSINLAGLVALTWEGHEFLDAIRDETVWEKTKEKARASGLDMQSLTFDLIKSLGMSIIKGQLGL